MKVRHVLQEKFITTPLTIPVTLEDACFLSLKNSLISYVSKPKKISPYYDSCNHFLFAKMFLPHEQKLE